VKRNKSRGRARARARVRPLERTLRVRDVSKQEHITTLIFSVIGMASALLHIDATALVDSRIAGLLYMYHDPWDLTQHHTAIPEEAQSWQDW
jgi:hypothetical protein